MSLKKLFYSYFTLSFLLFGFVGCKDDKGGSTTAAKPENQAQNQEVDALVKQVSQLNQKIQDMQQDHQKRINQYESDIQQLTQSNTQDVETLKNQMRTMESNHQSDAQKSAAAIQAAKDTIDQLSNLVKNATGDKEALGKKLEEEKRKLAEAQRIKDDLDKSHQDQKKILQNAIDEASNLKVVNQVMQDDWKEQEKKLKEEIANLQLVVAGAAAASASGGSTAAGAMAVANNKILELNNKIKELEKINQDFKIETKTLMGRIKDKDDTITSLEKRYVQIEKDYEALKKAPPVMAPAPIPAPAPVPPMPAAAPPVAALSIVYPSFRDFESTNKTFAKNFKDEKNQIKILDMYAEVFNHIDEMEKSKKEDVSQFALVAAKMIRWVSVTLKKEFHHMAGETAPILHLQLIRSMAWATYAKVCSLNSLICSSLPGKNQRNQPMKIKDLMEHSMANEAIALAKEYYESQFAHLIAHAAASSPVPVAPSISRTISGSSSGDSADSGIPDAPSLDGLDGTSSGDDHGAASPAAAPGTPINMSDALKKAKLRPVTPVAPEGKGALLAAIRDRKKINLKKVDLEKWAIERKKEDEKAGKKPAGGLPGILAAAMGNIREKVAHEDEEENNDNWED